MNLLTSSNQAPDAPKIRPARVAPCFGWFIWPVVVCLALAVNHAAAQQDPAVVLTDLRMPGIRVRLR